MTAPFDVVADRLSRHDRERRQAEARRMRLVKDRARRWALRFEDRSGEDLRGRLRGPCGICYEPNGGALTVALFETRELARQYARANRITGRADGFRWVLVPVRVWVTVEECE